MVDQIQKTQGLADLRLPMRLVEEFVDAERSPDDFTAAFMQCLQNANAGGNGKRAAIANLESRVHDIAKLQDGVHQAAPR
jgi:hypothetical protein